MSSGEEAPVLADVDLVQQCLEGNEEAIAELKRSLTPFLSKVLGSYGATKDEIDEILAQLWSDCLSARARSFMFSTAISIEIMVDRHLRQSLDFAQAA